MYKRQTLRDRDVEKDNLAREKTELESQLERANETLSIRSEEITSLSGERDRRIELEQELSIEKRRSAKNYLELEACRKAIEALKGELKDEKKNGSHRQQVIDDMGSEMESLKEDFRGKNESLEQVHELATKLDRANLRGELPSQLRSILSNGEEPRVAPK